MYVRETHLPNRLITPSMPKLSTKFPHTALNHLLPTATHPLPPTFPPPNNPLPHPPQLLPNPPLSRPLKAQPLHPNTRHHHQPHRSQTRPLPFLSADFASQGVGQADTGVAVGRDAHFREKVEVDGITSGSLR